MTEEVTIFEQQPTSVVPDTVPQVTIPTEIAELVGVGKKYATTEDALKSVPHAQKHISTLEAELAQAKEELTKRRTAAELLDEIKSGIQTPETQVVPEFNQDTVVQAVNQVLSQRERQTVANNNVSTVIAAFDKQYSDKGSDMYKALAVECGLSISALNTLAANSPGAVLKLAGLTKAPQPTISHIQSTVNTEGGQRQSDNSDLSARVPKGAKTKDMVNAWKNAGEKAKLKQG